MIFSIFGKKKDTGGRKRDGAGDAPAPSDTLINQREIARRTAEKIDEIELQMDLAIKGPGAGAVDADAKAAASAVSAPAPRGAEGHASGNAPGKGARKESAGRKISAPAQESSPSSSDVEPVQGISPKGHLSPAASKPVPTTAVPVRGKAGAGDLSSRFMAGEESATGAVEVRQTLLLPVFEETAVLYANNQAAAAATVLWQSIKENQLGPHLRQAWAMLFELYEASGRRADFDALALDFAARFETSPPMWREDLAPQGSQTDQVVNASNVVFSDHLGLAQASKQFDQLTRAFNRQRPVEVDFSRVKTVDPEAAESLNRLLVDFRKNSRELTLNGLEPLRAVLAGLVETGRRDPSEGIWLLLLEVLRLLREKQVFEDTAIDYCVTYEVSPPSWETLPSTIQVQGRGHTTMVEPAELVDADNHEVDGSALAFEGEIAGQADSIFTALREHAKTHRHLVIDCLRLRRIDFVCAGELLNEIAQLRAAGHTIEFRQLSHLVACLLMVMGVHDMADLKSRSI